MASVIKLTDKQIKNRLTKATGWTVNEDGEISKTYTFSGFPQALMFTTAVGVLAEAAQHHPDLTIKWNRVIVSLTTHDAGGLSAKDFDLATQIEGLPH